MNCQDSPEAKKGALAADPASNPASKPAKKSRFHDHRDRFTHGRMGDHLALIGNPNSGKTTLFNSLTGMHQLVGNYPGITVEKREGALKVNGLDITVVDLPGAYSLTAYSNDELVARNFLIDNHPDAIITVVDATNLERSLYLVLQIQELGVPLILALNMMDEVRKKGISIDSARLSDLLHAPVYEIVARTGEGREALIQEAYRAVTEPVAAEPVRISYGKDLDPFLERMEALITSANFLHNHYPPRWLALKYLENDAEILTRGTVEPETHARLLEVVHEASQDLRRTLDTEPPALIADFRYGYISSLLRGVVTRPAKRRYDLSDRLDAVLVNRLLGPVLMLGVIYAMFWLTFTVGAYPQRLVEAFFGWMHDFSAAHIPPGLLNSLVTAGIIDGVGGVLGFAPLIMIMFFFLTFLEDSGYLARMAYMLDRVFRIFGLHGSSVVPFIIGGGIPGGCAVPGVMASRTLRSPRERIATVLTTPFMTCGAKTPFFLLMAAAFFPGAEAKLLFSVTLGAWVMAMLVSLLLRSTIIKGPATPFVMELPPYRLPTLRGTLQHTWERVWQYVRKAGTVILAVSILIWAAMTFPLLPKERVAEQEVRRAAVEAQNFASNEARRAALSGIDSTFAREALSYSLAGRLGRALEPGSCLAGFDWRTNIALIGGFAAKEVVVATLGTAYSMGEIDSEGSEGLAAQLRKDPGWNRWVALAMIAFVLIYSPCFVTLAVIGREIGWKWSAFTMLFNTGLAFGLATAIYQTGRFFS